MIWSESEEAWVVTPFQNADTLSTTEASLKWCNTIENRASGGVCGDKTRPDARRGWEFSSEGVTGTQYRTLETDKTIVHDQSALKRTLSKTLESPSSP